MHEVGVLQIHCRLMCWSQKQRELVRECRAGGGNTGALQPAPSNHCQQGEQRRCMPVAVVVVGGGGSA